MQRSRFLVHLLGVVGLVAFGTASSFGVEEFGNYE